MLSIVMPAHNEEEIIEQTIREWNEEVLSRIPGAELIVVNDCSNDKTGEVLALLAREIKELRTLTPERNGGHGRALRFGFEQVTQDWVFQTDSDQQHVPADFWKLWEKREGSDFVMGVRSTRADGPVRVFITRVLRLANFIAWGLWIRDANCPFKLMRRGPMKKVLKRIPRDSFIPMVMLSIVCRKMNFRVSEVVVQHLPRRGGEQSLAGLWKWINVGSLCLRQLLALRMRPYLSNTQTRVATRATGMSENE
jgi:dolichol-phosphate mannosyltransferase